MKTSPRTTGPSGGDWIHLRKVKVRCVLGVHPAERGRARPVNMNISLECDTRRAAKSDKLEDTMNYELIESDAIAIAKTGHFRLIETLAERVAEVCLKHPQVRGVRVVVDKPGALPHTKSVAVEIERRK
jgi:D-erythro-7,8-dihydroneopterin triphosphate epimerase